MHPAVVTEFSIVHGIWQINLVWAWNQICLVWHTVLRLFGLFSWSFWTFHFYYRLLWSFERIAQWTGKALDFNSLSCRRIYIQTRVHNARREIYTLVSFFLLSRVFLRCCDNFTTQAYISYGQYIFLLYHIASYAYVSVNQTAQDLNNWAIYQRNTSFLINACFTIP